MQAWPRWCLLLGSAVSSAKSVAQAEAKLGFFDALRCVDLLWVER